MKTFNYVEEIFWFYFMKYCIYKNIKVIFRGLIPFQRIEAAQTLLYEHLKCSI